MISISSAGVVTTDYSWPHLGESKNWVI